MVFDGGYGGELFADKLEEELPIVNVIRVIDWRNSEGFLKNARLARQKAIEALKPYIGRVDLIIIANFLIATTSLKYFQRKFKNQKFCGLELPCLNNSFKKSAVLITTKALAKTLNYHNYIFRLKREVCTLRLDEWVQLIDGGELDDFEVRNKFEEIYRMHQFKSSEIVIACSHFYDVVPIIQKIFGNNVKIHDGFNETINEACKILKIKGGTGKKRK